MQEKWLTNKREGQAMINRSGISPEYSGEGTYVGYWKLLLGANKLTFCSKVRKMLEITRTKESGMRAILKLMQPEQRRELIFEMQQACSNGINFERNVRLTTSKGKVKWMRITGILYYRRWGKAEQMVGTIEDMTQKVNEECMSLAIVNHELRAPLTIIKLNTQMLINQFAGTLNKGPIKLLNSVDQHIDNMTKVLEDYLCTSHDELRVKQLNLSVFDIHDVVDTVINEMKTLHTSYRFYKEPGEPLMVRADKYQIVQVLINYITNAVNFSPTCSHVKVNVSYVNGEVEVAVHDQGIGIPFGQEQQLFQRFYRCDQKAVRQKNSKGLGLYLVKKIITEHYGSVRAERGKEGGAVFYFTLPLHEEQKFARTHYAVANAGY
ncbi:sensor histidine kinase [Mucilaginibacter agri]|uniref:histidine kinase n=1 Tax=Mucilaginibacter agri TaxID=2695265 RepID=A0A966DUT6_9SPHI|nr:PAS domain-containing sensor histidine kinase [Mucilaginibacter agri]NCD72115.1 hypothetical protein [Mucilaginibacter agri]